MVPDQVMWAYPVIGLFVGDVLKNLKLSQWIIAANVLIAGTASIFMLEMGNPIVDFFYGANLGLAATGLHRASKSFLPQRS